MKDETEIRERLESLRCQIYKMAQMMMFSSCAFLRQRVEELEWVLKDD